MTTPTTHSAGLLPHAPDRISSFDQKPDSGGTPAMASQPMMKRADGDRQVLAERAHAPHVLLVVRCRGSPSRPPRNSSALKKAWVIMWKMAAT